MLCVLGVTHPEPDSPCYSPVLPVSPLPIASADPTSDADKTLSPVGDDESTLILSGNSLDTRR